MTRRDKKCIISNVRQATTDSLRWAGRCPSRTLLGFTEPELEGRNCHLPNADLVAKGGGNSMSPQGLRVMKSRYRVANEKKSRCANTVSQHVLNPANGNATIIQRFGWKAHNISMSNAGCKSSRASSGESACREEHRPMTSRRSSPTCMNSAS